MNNDGEADDYALDMEEFGLLVKRMLRIYHMRVNSPALNNTYNYDEKHEEESQHNNGDLKEETGDK